MCYGSAANHPVLVCILPGSILLFFPLGNVVARTVSNGLALSLPLLSLSLAPISNLLLSNVCHHPFLSKTEHLKESKHPVGPSRK